jgi:hypothetical protein
MATATRTHLRPTPRIRVRTEIHVLDNPLAGQDPALAAAVESTLGELLGGEELGQVEVRLRICRELDEGGLRFICKIENPPEPDFEQRRRLPWRWWSPLMETAQDFRSALQEALQLRRERLQALEYSPF